MEIELIVADTVSATFSVFIYLVGIVKVKK
jgi:hypothetical protein